MSESENGVMRFILNSFGHLLRGGLAYWAWVALLTAIVALGGWHYYLQLRDGLVVTHMTNQVSWGLYLSLIHI